MIIDRRSALMLGATMTAAVGLTPARGRAARHEDLRNNPVLFWNGISLDLIALDHSIDPKDARAPGPCATARALGVVHAVIADAVSIAYPTNYKPQFYRGDVNFDIELPELFVSGAAAGILSHIFNAPIHAYKIGASRDEFQKLVGTNGGKDWQAGVAFSSAPQFRELWKWSEMQTLLLPQFSTYIPRPRRHNNDPYNAGQGNYGTDWGTYRPLVLDGTRQVAHLAPGAPPPEGSPEYEHDLAEVRVKGALISKGDEGFSARTPKETNVGLFWAYDGPRLLGTPPRLYNQILRKIAIDDEMDVVEMARLFALSNLAMADAGIVAWWAKYKYAVWRPVIGIQNHVQFPVPDWRPFGSPKTNPTRFALGVDTQTRDTAQALMGGGASIFGSQSRLDGSANPSQRAETQYRDAAFTPSFPAYPSGHATFGAACFHVLKLIRQERPSTRHDPDRIVGPFVSDELNGTSIDHFRNEPRPYFPIDYRSIDQMIRDNDLSRIYLGVHWRFDCNRGSESGANIGWAVYQEAYNIGDGPERRDN
jgi:membrane-associated phospholipid phosphatase